MHACQNPAFHHYIFETLAAMIKHICSSGDANATATMEGLILPPFQVYILSLNPSPYTPNSCSPPTSAKRPTY